jgi:hypothetical protein
MPAGRGLIQSSSRIEKRRLIEVLCLNSTWKDGSLSIICRKPFNELTEFSFVNQGVPKVVNFEHLIRGIDAVNTIRIEA